MSRLISHYMNAFPDRFIFTDTDHRECFEIIRMMKKLVDRATEVKPPNLEEEAYQTNILFLRKALFLYIDNIEYETFTEIMENYIVFGGYEGRELLERLIILEGLKGIYNSESSGLIEERLKAYLGERFTAEYERKYYPDQNIFTENLPVFEAKAVVQPDITSFLRKKVEPKQSNPNVVLSQKEIDDLVKTLLG